MQPVWKIIVLGVFVNSKQCLFKIQPLLWYLIVVGTWPKQKQAAVQQSYGTITVKSCQLNNVNFQIIIDFNPFVPISIVAAGSANQALLDGTIAVTGLLHSITGKQSVLPATNTVHCSV